MRHLTLIVFAVIAAGCSERNSNGVAAVPAAGSQVASADADLPQGHPGMGGAAIDGPPHLSGIVEETLTSAGFTYLRLRTADGETWVAMQEGPQPLRGTSVNVHVTMSVAGFHAPSIGRTFEAIHFGHIEDGHGHSPAATPPRATGGDFAALDGFVRASTGSRRSVADVFAAKDSLNEKRVSVRGQVVKFTAGVMGKNWIHLQDGSGSAAAGDDDITITTLDEVGVGETITATGTLRLDRDFGSGYAYPLILEDARISR